MITKSLESLKALLISDNNLTEEEVNIILRWVEDLCRKLNINAKDWEKVI